MWCRGVVFVITAQLKSTKAELRFCISSIPTHGLLQVCDDKKLRQWFCLKIRLVAFVDKAFCKMHHHYHLLTVNSYISECLILSIFRSPGPSFCLPNQASDPFIVYIVEEYLIHLTSRNKSKKKWGENPAEENLSFQVARQY